MTQVCVECGAVKGQGNGWLFCWVRKGAELEFHCRELYPSDSTAEGDIVCGDNCGHRCYQQFLERKRTEQ